MLLKINLKINIHLFTPEFLKETFMPVIEEHIREYGGTEPLEYIMQDIVKNKKSAIKPFETGDLKWFEIDDLEELKIAENMFRGKLDIKEIRALHGGYWRYNLLDFHYLVNCHFPTREMYNKIQEKVSLKIS